MREKSTEERFGSRTLWDTLEEMARQRIQHFVQELLEEEVTALVGRAKSQRRALVGQERRVYRNGYGKPRRLSLSCGTIELRRPRVRGMEERFESRVLPLFQRRTRQVGELLPQLYLHGLAQGDFELALRGLLGEGVPLSGASIGRLREKWVAEYEAWSKRSLVGLEPVYLWADGIYVKAGLEKDKAALLVVLAALADGRKVLLAVEAGHRESASSWAALLRALRALRARGLQIPKLVVADGHLGIWAALGEVFPEVSEQRCWNHKLVNVVDRLLRRLQAQARELLQPIPYAPTREQAEKLRDRFVDQFRVDHPAAAETLLRDWERMVTFYDFPKEHWKHLRTTNPIESPFASVRLRTNAGKRYKKVANATALIWRLLLVAEKNFRRIDHPELLSEVLRGKPFVDGIRVVVQDHLPPAEEVAA